MSLVGTTLDGKFRLDKALASGAGGDVYEATHLALGAPVAVKVLRAGPPETGDIRRKRFLREARVAAGLRTDHVVRIYDVVAPESGLTYIVMELLQGETLADRVQRAGPLPVAEAIGFVLQAAKPLGQMHAQGIVHRDVKPSNLFLARDADGHEVIKLLDFGVAAFQRPVARDSSLTLTEAMVGTPRYMAPEQVQSSRSVDARADVWALGITLYEMLAGKPPFDGQTVLAVLNQIERQEPKPLGDVRSGIPPALAALVHACLAKDPAGRPADARELVEALGAMAGPAPRAKLPRRWLMAGGLGLAVIVLGALALRRAAEAPAQAALPGGPGVAASIAMRVAAPAAPSATASAVASVAAALPVAPGTDTVVAPPAGPAPVASVTASAPHRTARPLPRGDPPRPAARKPPRDDDRIE
jgi:eukaryotic-like serine/threonine-protein kinase